MAELKYLQIERLRGNIANKILCNSERQFFRSDFYFSQDNIK